MVWTIFLYTFVRVVLNCKTRKIPVDSKVCEMLLIGQICLLCSGRVMGLASWLPLLSSSLNYFFFPPDSFFSPLFSLFSPPNSISSPLDSFFSPLDSLFSTISPLLFYRHPLLSSLPSSLHLFSPLSSGLPLLYYLPSPLLQTPSSLLSITADHSCQLARAG